MQAWDSVYWSMFASTSPRDQHPVRLAPVGDVPGRVPRCIEDLEAGDLIPLGDRAVRPCARAPWKIRQKKMGNEVVGLSLVDQLGILRGRHIELRAPEGDPQAARRRRGLAPW